MTPLDSGVPARASTSEPSPAPPPVRRRGRSPVPGWVLSRREALLLTGLVLLAAVLRLLLLSEKSLWLDEAFSVALARQPWPTFWDQVTHREANMSLYFALLRLWLPVGDGEAAVRLLSVMPAVATVPLLYVLGRRLYGPRAGLLAALLLAIHAAHVRYAQQARGYALLILLLTLAAFLLERALERPSGRRWAA